MKKAIKDSIKYILESNNGFMDIKVLNKELNNFEDEKYNIKEKDIILTVLKYPSVFYYINGLVIDVNEETFQQIKQCNNDINNILVSFYFEQLEIQYIVSFLFFYKRLSENHGYKLIDINLNSFTCEEEIKDLFIKNLEEFDTYHNFEVDIVQSFIDYIGYKHIAFEKIFNILDKLDTTKYSQVEFGIIYEYVINKYTTYLNNKSIQQLILKFIDLEDNSTLIDPFGGNGGLLVESIKKNSTVSIEYNDINHISRQVAFMSLYMYGKSNIKFNFKDSFSSYNKKKYDYLITELPFISYPYSNNIANMKNNNLIGIINSREPLLYHILYILSKINNNGKAVFNVPTKFLSNTSFDYIKVRRYLIKNDLIETIVNLPLGARYYSGINMSLLFINFNKQDKNKIKIINAQWLYEAKTKSREIINESILDINRITDSYQYETKDSFFLDIDKIYNKDYKLDSTLFGKEIFELYNSFDNGKAKYLKDLAIIKKGKNFNPDNLANQKGVPIVKIQNLHNDVLDLYINENDTFDMLQNINKNDIIDKECILIASVGGRIKPTMYKPSDKLPKIFITTNIIALILNKDIVSIEYIYYQMYSKIVTEQRNNLTSGSIRTFFTISNISELIIPYVSLLEQKNFIDSQKANIIASERAELETKLALIGYKEEIASKESDIIRTLTHQLRATLATINMEVDILKSIIDVNNIKNLKNVNLIMPDDDDFEKPIDYTLGEISDKIYINSKKLKDSLETVDKVMRFKLEDKDFVNDNLYDFFIKHIESKKTENGNNFTINVKGKSVYVDFNKKSFVELLDQLISNAKRHAFKTNDNGYKIDFNIIENKSKRIVTIQYFNNGRKFNVSREDYIGAFKKGQSSDGSGIGGNFIYRIIKAHNGDLFIDEINEIGFKFKIEIPLKHNGEIDE